MTNKVKQLKCDNCGGVNFDIGFLEGQLSEITFVEKGEIVKVDAYLFVCNNCQDTTYIRFRSDSYVPLPSIPELENIEEYRKKLSEEN
jgi:hypothetical protein